MSSTRRHRRGAQHEEEHVNHERWLLTYSDMITLLMVLFIVLFAMSTVDSKKFDELKESLAGAFGGAPSVLSESSNTTQDQNDSISPSEIDLQTGAAADSNSSSGQDTASAQQQVPQQVQQQIAQQAVQDADRVKASQEAQAAEQEVAWLRQLQAKMEAALHARGLDGDAQFRIDQTGLVVSVVTNSVVFGGDSAVLLPAGKAIVDALVPTLAGIGNQLAVAGHTNQLPVPTRNYPSSWELSSARASSVVRYLVDRYQFNPGRLSATGYADTRPLVPPSDPTSVTRNRRVEITVVSNQPPGVRALLPAAAGEK